METNMTAAEITDFLKANPPAPQFVPYTLLSKEADALTVYFEGDPDYSKRSTTTSRYSSRAKRTKSWAAGSRASPS